MKRKVLKSILCIFAALVIAAGGYLANMFGLFHNGNRGEYSMKNIQTNQNSPLQGKTVLFLGSSVTYGYGSLGESFADFLAQTDGIVCIKEAVSGTTLADLKTNSYVNRMKNMDTSIKADAFVCQLSTNDATKQVPLGQIADGFSQELFDTKTVAGAIEYIISYAKKTWNCPVVFYTQAKYDSTYYGEMVLLLSEIAAKWNITVLDLWNDEAINTISEQQRSLYLVDAIHPTKAGYTEWWLPSFRACLTEVIR